MQTHASDIGAQGQNLIQIAPTMNHWVGYSTSQEKNPRTQKLMRTMLKTVKHYDLINPDDHILVAVSGGKDSYTMLDLLNRARGKSPRPFKITAVHLNQNQPGYDGRPLAKWLQDSGISHHIESEDTYSVVMDKTKPGATYCSLCSRLRRGVLYRVARELGCTKIALGHHRDDALETFLLNLFYAGKLQAMPAKYKTDTGEFDVIRPLIECSEHEIALHSKREDYPILPCNLCATQEGMKRDRMTELITDLEKEIPDIRAVMAHALKNIKPTHLLDKRLLS